MSRSQTFWLLGNPFWEEPGARNLPEVWGIRSDCPALGDIGAGSAMVRSSCYSRGRTVLQGPRDASSRAPPSTPYNTRATTPQSQNISAIQTLSLQGRRQHGRPCLPGARQGMLPPQPPQDQKSDVQVQCAVIGLARSRNKTMRPLVSY